MAYEDEKRKIMELAPCGLKDCYIAGGAVTSVFTNKPINDVDVYFKTERAFQDAVASAYAASNAIDLFEAIAELKREPFDEKWFDDDGFPIEAKAA